MQYLLSSHNNFVKHPFVDLESAHAQNFSPLDQESASRKKGWGKFAVSLFRDNVPPGLLGTAVAIAAAQSDDTGGFTTAFASAAGVVAGTVASIAIKTLQKGEFKSGGKATSYIGCLWSNLTSKACELTKTAYVAVACGITPALVTLAVREDEGIYNRTTEAPFTTTSSGLFNPPGETIAAALSTTIQSLTGGYLASIALRSLVSLISHLHSSCNYESSQKALDAVFSLQPKEFLKDLTDIFLLAGFAELSLNLTGNQNAIKIIVHLVITAIAIGTKIGAETGFRRALKKKVLETIDESELPQAIKTTLKYSLLKRNLSKSDVIKIMKTVKRALEIHELAAEDSDDDYSDVEDFDERAPLFERSAIPTAENVFNLINDPNWNWEWQDATDLTPQVDSSNQCTTQNKDSEPNSDLLEVQRVMERINDPNWDWEWQETTDLFHPRSTSPKGPFELLGIDTTRTGDKQSSTKASIDPIYSPTWDWEWERPEDLAQPKYAPQKEDKVTSVDTSETAPYLDNIFLQIRAGNWDAIDGFNWKSF